MGQQENNKPTISLFDFEKEAKAEGADLDGVQIVKPDGWWTSPYINRIKPNDAVVVSVSGYSNTDSTEYVSVETEPGVYSAGNLTIGARVSLDGSVENIIPCTGMVFHVTNTSFQIKDMGIGKDVEDGVMLTLKYQNSGEYGHSNAITVISGGHRKHAIEQKEKFVRHKSGMSYPKKSRW